MNETFEILLSNKPDHWHTTGATQRQCQVLGILFRSFTQDRALRLYLIGNIIGRTIHTTRSLSLAEASALLEMAYTNREIDEDFSAYIRQEITHVTR